MTDPRPRRAAAIAACLALWAALYALAGASEWAEIGGDVLLLIAFCLALITPWTPAQRARAARRVNPS